MERHNYVDLECSHFSIVRFFVLYLIYISNNMIFHDCFNIVRFFILYLINYYSAI